MAGTPQETALSTRYGNRSVVACSLKQQGFWQLLLGCLPVPPDAFLCHQMMYLVLVAAAATASCTDSSREVLYGISQASSRRFAMFSKQLQSRDSECTAVPEVYS